MNTTDLVHFLTTDAPQWQASARPALAPSRHELQAPVRNSILRARTDLVDAQRVDGSWSAGARGDAASYSFLVMLDAFLESEPSNIAELAVAAIFREQQAHGGWSLHRGGPIDLDRSVLAYFALKLAGESACRPELVRARQAIRAQGGADACSAAARLWFALLGQIDYGACPTISPEWLLMPGYTEHNSADETCRTAARAVIWALRPTRDLHLSRGIRELFVEPPQNWRTPVSSDSRPPFPALSGFWKGCERVGWLPLRRRALERAEFLLTEATAELWADEIQCEDLVWRLIALKSLGHAPGGRAIAACQQLLERFAGDESDDARSRPHTSLTSDTALALEALRASGLGTDTASIATAVEWLIAHRLDRARRARHPSEVAALVQVLGCLQDSDESIPCALPPDIKLAGGRRSGECPSGQRLSREFENSAGQLLGQAICGQQPDGGWTLGGHGSARPRVHGILHASGDRSRRVSDAESTGMMLVFVARLRSESIRTPIARGAAFLSASQHGDGSWTSPAGLPSVSATAWAIRGLIAAGAESRDKAVAAGVNWLLVQQRVEGGWGDSHERFITDEESQDLSIPDTAAAVAALVEAGLADDEAIRRAVDVLVDCDFENSHGLFATARKLIALSKWQMAIARLGDGNEIAPLRLICGDATS